MADATDTFTIDARDDEDLSYGIRGVDLAGSAANSGTGLEHHSTLTDKRNSGCDWKQDEGEEGSGSWSGSGDVHGDLNFSEDGSYSISVSADSSGPNGESAPDPELPGRRWLKYSDISAGCEINYEPYDEETTMPPAPWWVSTQLNDTDINNEGVAIEGQISSANNGVLEGPKTWQMRSPEGFMLTIAWHLVHDGPIVLPHS